MDRNQEDALKLTDVPVSFWIDTTDDTDYPALESNIEVDAVIVGGGITGLTAAYLLKKHGIRTAVIEANRIAKGVSGHTTAKITSQHSLKYFKMIKAVGEEMTRQYASANQAAIDMIESIIRENKIECDFKRTPAYVYTQDESYIQKLEDETESALRLGLPAAYTDTLDLPFGTVGAMRFDDQAYFHPRKYLLGLASAIEGDDLRIYENTRAVDIREADKHTVVTDNGMKIRAKYVIQATRYPFYDKPGLYFARVYPERTYLMGVRINGSFPDGMYISAEQPTRTLRLHKGKDTEMMLVGGDSHKTGHGANLHNHYEVIKDFAKPIFDITGIPYRWSAQDYTAMDEIPFAGHMTADRKNIFVATGFDKWGITNGTASAMLIADLITKGESPWEEVYSPSRFTPGASAKNFIIENADVAIKLISGKLNMPLGNEAVEKGKAVITEVDGCKVGVYRDNSDKLHYVSTTCTHLGCELKWNSAELSWDCPCHGSRFTYDGDIIEGPALESIKPLESGLGETGGSDKADS
jgi:glycine/D-amino acid oxidase-like deaminating enzyme/nitrite reductase/ring-hydroxylating ferredoxin subunit